METCRLIAVNFPDQLEVDKTGLLFKVDC